MKRRLDLAISMIERPALVFLDEPTTGLDPRSREQVWGTVRDLADEGVTILLTTQYLEEADQLADTIALLDHGRVVARGTADELKASIGTEVVRLQFGDRDSYGRALRQHEAVRADSRLLILEVASNGSAAQVRELLGQLEAAGAPALKVSTHRPSLDDVFLSLTGAGAAPAAAPATTRELAR
jgi:ABC-2 type transport system ATP-binding protein